MLSGIISTSSTDSAERSLSTHNPEVALAAVNKFADLARIQNEVPASVAEHYRALGRTASDCIACHACKPNCPFGVRIAERMEETVGIFGE